MLRLAVSIVVLGAALHSATLDQVAQQAYLKASNTQTGDSFGGAVSVSGDTLVVAAAAEDSHATGVNGDQDDDIADYYNSGAAYVFVRDGAGWSQQAYLKSAVTGQVNWFGSSVSISGDTIVIGERGQNGGSGAAYVFVRNGTVWSQQAYLKASNPQSVDFFGSSVAVSGDTIVVGAPGEASMAAGVNGDQSNNGAASSGAAYVFLRNGTTWSQQAYLKASNTGANDMFGGAVSISGNTVVVGASAEASSSTGVNGTQTGNTLADAGAAYVFVRHVGTWSQQAYLKASNTGLSDLFGSTVAVSGDTVVVGAYGEGSTSTGVNGDQTNGTTAWFGAAYVFVRQGATWSQQAYLKQSNTEANDLFGTAVAVSGDTVVVAAVQEDSNASGVNGDQSNNHATHSGAAYVFARDGTSWSQQAYVKASNTGKDDRFGSSVAVSGSTLVAGAMNEDSSAKGVNGNQANDDFVNSGAAYVFDLAAETWVDLGSGHPGSMGTPLLVGTGSLSAGSANELDVTNASGSSTATLVFGVSPLDAPFKGGVLVPAPLLTIPLPTSAAGSASLPFILPPGLPAGFALYFQAWIQDAGASHGFAATNGLQGVTSE